VNSLISKYRPTFGILGLAALVGLSGVTNTRAADHRDSPRITNNIVSMGNLDILDVYAFQSPQNKANTVLIMTMSTDAGVLTPTVFNSNGLYEFRVLNQISAGQLSPNIVLQIGFTPPDSKLRQTFMVSRITETATTILAKGTTNKSVALKGGGKVQAGLFDDPFFFDLLAFNKFKALALAGDPTAGNVFLHRSGGTVNPNIPNNFFGGFNCIAIVLEVPSVSLQSSKTNTSIGVWARTTVPGATFGVENPDQFDRKGRPGINTVLMPDALKDAFNSGSPETDAQFRPAAMAELGLLFGTPDATRTAQVNLLLPDVLTLKTKDGDGFDKLNGRRLADDVIDVELSLLTVGTVTTDNVTNDSVFRSSFPYLGTPNPKLPVHR
jgi:hypothetical protein